MSALPKAISRLIEKFERLPGVGPKSAQRLVFYLLHNPEAELADFANRLIALKKETVLCAKCHNVSDQDPCQLCEDSYRDTTSICVVEQPLDVFAIERSGTFKGYYHVLHGVISPLNNIGPDQLYIHDLVERLDGVEELILATNPTMEGEATALYIRDLIYRSGRDSQSIKITRIGHGLPIGADIEYTDGVTLSRALEGRRTL